MKQVRITGSDHGSWYTHKIGSVYEVKPIISGSQWIVKEKYGSNSIRFINYEDCEVITPKTRSIRTVRIL